MTIKTAITSFFKILTVVLVLAFLLPSVVKLSHAFNHHTHEVCDDDTNKTATHFHSLDLDCDFYKFKLNNTHYLLSQPAKVVLSITLYKVELPYYNFLRNHQQTQSYLRGPPSIA